MFLWSSHWPCYVTILALKVQANTGSNAAAQQGGSGGGHHNKGNAAGQQGGSGGGHHNKGNSATQGITQGQSNAQNALCLSGVSHWPCM